MLINQLPWLYSGTLRENLDPFNEYTDERMWKCLEMASVSKQFRNLNGLDTVLSESGGNLSWEKQLVCLARSILGENKILFLMSRLPILIFTQIELYKMPLGKWMF